MPPNPASATSPDVAPTSDQPPAPKESRRRPPPIFSGDPEPGGVKVDSALPDQPDQPSPGRPSNGPSPENGSASESPDGGKKRRRRDRGASGATPSIADRRQIKAAIAAGVELLGVQLHMQAADREPMAAESGLWLADEQDKEGIAEPVSAIVARRGGPGIVNPDLGDAIAAAIALAVYLSKNLNLRAKIRQLRRAEHLPPADEPAGDPDKAAS